MSKWVYQADGFSTDEESCVLHETVFHNGNGYIGVRSNFVADNYILYIAM